MNDGLELVVLTLARTECFQRSEPNRLVRRNASVELARGQHIERPLRDVERVDVFLVLTSSTQKTYTAALRFALSAKVSVRASQSPVQGGC